MCFASNLYLFGLPLIFLWSLLPIVISLPAVLPLLCNIYSWVEEQPMSPFLFFKKIILQYILVWFDLCMQETCAHLQEMCPLLEQTIFC